jgi:hypothetical protein
VELALLLLLLMWLIIGPRLLLLLMWLIMELALLLLLLMWLITGQGCCC